MKMVKGFETFIADPVKEWKKDFDPLKDEPQDFVEAYMQEVAKTDDPESSFYKALGGKHVQLFISCVNVIINFRILDHPARYLCTLFYREKW